jgi:hypothetical protein
MTTRTKSKGFKVSATSGSIMFPKIKKVKSKSKSALKRQADKMFSLKVRSIGWCQFQTIAPQIKCSQNLQCMHIIGRANHQLRWDFRNAMCGCSGHHMYFTCHPAEFYILIAEKFPKIWKYLVENRNKIWDKDIEKVIIRLI